MFSWFNSIPAWIWIVLAILYVGHAIEKHLIAIRDHISPDERHYDEQRKVDRELADIR